MKKLSKVLYVILFFVLAYFIYAGVGFVSNLKSQEKNAVSLIEKNVPGLVSSWTYSKAFFDAVRVKEADFVRNYPYLIQNVGSCSLEGKPVCDARYEKNFGSKAKNDVLCQVKLKCEKIKNVSAEININPVTWKAVYFNLRLPEIKK